MRRALLGVVLLSLLPGCWERIPLGAAGFRCENDGDCGEALRCVSKICATAPARCDRDEECGDALRCLDNTCATPPPRDVPFPYRAAYFIGSFPYSWGTPPDNTRYEPDLGKYVTEDAIGAQLRAFEHGRIQVGLFSWYGPGRDTDVAFGHVVDATASAGSTVRWAVVYEREALDFPDVATARSVLNDVRGRYVERPNYLLRDGLPVVFVRTGWNTDVCDAASRWVEANGAGESRRAWLALLHWTSQDPASCSSRPDASLPMDTTKATFSGLDGFMASPGHWHYSDATARLERSPESWRTRVIAMVASKAKIQLVATFNDWNLGASVEGSPSWTSPSGFGTYLDILHELPTQAP